MLAKVTNILTDEEDADEQEIHTFNSDPTVNPILRRHEIR